MTTRLPLIFSIMKDATDFFETKQVPYVVIGGITVNILARPRTTIDVDLIVDQRLINNADFFQYMQNKGYILALEDLEEGFRTKSNITIGSGKYTLDIKGIYNKLDRLAIDQAIKVEVFKDFTILINRPELLIVAKLAYASEQDFEDAAAAYKKSKDSNTLDQEYLTKIASEFGVAGRIKFLDQISSGKLTGEQLSDILDNLELVDWL